MTSESSTRPESIKCPCCGAKAYEKYRLQYKCYKCGELTTLKEGAKK